MRTHVAYTFRWSHIFRYIFHWRESIIYEFRGLLRPNMRNQSWNTGKNPENTMHWQPVNTNRIRTFFTTQARSTTLRLDPWNPAPPISTGVEVRARSFPSEHRLQDFPLNLQLLVSHHDLSNLLTYTSHFSHSSTTSLLELDASFNAYKSSF